MDTSYVISIVNKLINGATVIGISLMVLWAVFSGIRLGISGGNPTAEAEAKRSLTHAIVGVILILGARGFIAMIESVMK